MSDPFFVICDGQPVPGTGLPMTVFHLFDGVEERPEILIYGRSRHQPEGPILRTAQDEAYALDFHSEDPHLGWRLGRVARVNHLTVRPRPKEAAARVRALGLRRAVIFGPGSDLMFYANRLMTLLPEVEASIYIVDDLRVPLTSSRNLMYRWYGSAVAKSLLARCASRYVITDEMGEEYRRAYRLSFEVLPLPIPDEEYHQAVRHSSLAPAGSGPTFDIFLAGSLGPLYASSLRSLARAFQRLAVRSITPRLLVAGKTSEEELLSLGFQRQHICQLGWLPTQEDVLKHAAAADCSFVPYVFDPAQRNFIRMSFPGKTAYYFAAGSPVVCRPLRTRQSPAISGAMG